MEASEGGVGVPCWHNFAAHLSYHNHEHKQFEFVMSRTRKFFKKKVLEQFLVSFKQLRISGHIIIQNEYVNIRMNIKDAHTHSDSPHKPVSVLTDA